MKNINEAITEHWETGDYDWGDVARVINRLHNKNLSGNACRKRYKRYMKALGKPLFKKDQSQGGLVRDSWLYEKDSPELIIPLTTEQLSPYEQFVEATGIDQNQFEIEKAKVWGTANSPGFSAVWKPRSLPTEEQMDSLLERLKTVPRQIERVFPSATNGCSAVFSIYDLHLEQLAFDGTGIDQAVQGYHAVLNQLSKHVMPYNLDEIVLVVGNDMGNTDNPQNMTTAGTQQENSTTWRSGIDTQCELVVRAIDNLKSHQTKIKVIIVQGNHDTYRSYFIGKFIDAWYHNDPNVEVDNQHNPRKYHRFGDVALMFTHGNAESRNKLPLLFSTEGNHVFAGAKWREILTGHLHGMRETFHMITEDAGVITRILPGLVSADEWHTLKGYVGNNKLGNVDLYSKEGQVARFFASV